MSEEATIETQDNEDKAPDAMTAEELRQQLSRARREAKTYRLSLRDAEKQVEELSKDHQKVTQDFTTLKTEVKTKEHKAAFGEVARSLKVRADALDDLWNLSGYQPESDEPDPEHIKTALTSALETRSWLLEVDTPAPKPLTPGPGAARGHTQSNGQGFMVSKQDLRNPEWMQINGKKFREATKAHEVVYVD